MISLTARNHNSRVIYNDITDIEQVLNEKKALAHV